MTSKIILKYSGPGWVAGIPARDLMAADLADLARRLGVTKKAALTLILDTGLYQETATKKQED